MFSAEVFRKLEKEDLRVLQVIEAGMSKHKFVPKKLITDYTKFSSKETFFRLDRVSEFRLVRRRRGAYVGYTLNYAGYDCLAINALVKSGVLEALGKSLGVGKEADVYDALNPKGENIAVKFHRLGRVSFRETMRKRGYADRRTGWLYRSRLSAEKEFKGLKVVFPCGMSVPEPITQNRHVVVMGMIAGVELAEYKDIPEPKQVLKQILREIRKAYLKAHVIHADLSEYNILVDPDMKILIIDWPQYVTKDHLNAQQLLKRDIKNVLQFFRRKHLLKVEVDKCLDYVTGRIKTLDI
ncbi:MAG: serine/threonine-protein kinase RIO2 [Thermoproteota archaeon]